MSSGIVPTARPVVKVEPNEYVEGGTIAICHVEGCDWYYANVVKADVVEQARWHRDHHRAAAAGGAR